MLYASLRVPQYLKPLTVKSPLSSEVIEMASSKCKVLFRQKVNSKLRTLVSCLRKENAHLKKALFELSRQHSQHNNLVKRFLSLEAVRLECFQSLTAKNEKTAMVSEKANKKEEKQTEDCTSDEWSLTKVTELQNQLSNALEKNKQWMEYDQQRETYVRAILARMLWLEKQLNDANQALSQQHNEDYSAEKEQISQMQEHYERLLKKAKDELEVLKEQVDMTHQNLKVTQKWCKERQNEVEDLKQLLQTEKESRESAREVQYFEDEEQQLREETKDHQYRLDEEKRRSATFTLQFMSDYHHANQENIEDLQRQRDQQDHGSCEVTPPPSLTSRDSLTSSPHSLLNESFLACPNCQAQYPASRYRELMNHLEVCLD